MPGSFRVRRTDGGSTLRGGHTLRWPGTLTVAGTVSTITGTIVQQSQNIFTGAVSTITGALISQTQTIYTGAISTITSTLTNSAAFFRTFTGIFNVFGLAAQFVRASNERLNIADNASLSTGDIDFSIVTWPYLDTTGNNMVIVGKFDSAGNNREYRLRYSTSDDRFQFRVSPDGTNVGMASLNADSFGNVATGAYNLVITEHDATANTINIQVNNGTIDSIAHTTGLTDLASAFQIGADGGDNGHWNGRIANTGFWKRTLTTAEKTWLYNAGSSRVYNELGTIGDGSDLLTSLEAYWNLDETSGNRVDSHGSNTLSDVNTVTSATGNLSPRLVGALINQAQNILAGTISTITGAIIYQSQNIFAGTISAITGTIIYQTQHFIVGTISTITGALINQAQTFYTGAISTITGTIINQAQSIYTGNISTITGTIINQTQIILAGVISTITGTHLPGIFLSGVITPTGAIRYQVQHLLAGTISTIAGTLLNRPEIFPSGTLSTITGALINLLQKFFAGVITPIGAVLYQAQTIFTGTIATISGALINQVRQIISGAIATITGALTAIRQTPPATMTMAIASVTNQTLTVARMTNLTTTVVSAT